MLNFFSIIAKRAEKGIRVKKFKVFGKKKERPEPGKSLNSKERKILRSNS
jgi:hypothetical protein